LGHVQVTHELTPRAGAALTRVFRIFDTDSDGLLSDQELNELQACGRATALLRTRTEID
jgi:Ca2+-binding EF-hand superfamily protein